MSNNLYHFTSIDSVIRIILTDSFRLTSLRKVNDFGESEPITVLIKNSNKKEEKNSSPSTMRRNIFNYKNRLTSQCYAGCFSYLNFPKDKDFEELKTIVNKVTMWGHYADNNAGACLVIDKNKFDNLFNELEDEKNLYIKSYNQITYEANTINFGERYISEEDVVESLFFKYKDWSIENEYRYLIMDKYSDRAISNDYIKLENFTSSIKGIILGLKTTEEDFQIISKLFESIGVNQDSIVELARSDDGVVFLKPRSKRNLISV